MRRKLPPFPAVRAFEAAARHLNFKAAAEELCVTQSAISHQVKGLEEFLGTTLFHRSANCVRLTRCGAGYFDDVTTAIQGGQSSVTALTGSTEEEQFGDAKTASGLKAVEIR